MNKVFSGIDSDVKDVARRRGLRVRKCDRTGKGG